MRTRLFLSVLVTVAALQTGCTMPGEIAKGVDPVEGRLVQQLVEESCGEVIYRDATHTEMHRRKITADDVAVLDIEDLPDGGRIASIRVGGAQKFSYHPRFGMVRCGAVESNLGSPLSYTHSSGLLIEHGGNPDLYSAYKQDYEGKRRRAATRRDATFPIHVTWEGIEGTIDGTLREIRENGQGALAIQLPEPLGICTGVYRYTGKNKGTWNVSCPNDLTASGTYQSGNGAHGQGVDNTGRKITYSIDVKG